MESPRKKIKVGEHYTPFDLPSDVWKRAMSIFFDMHMIINLSSTCKRYQSALTGSITSLGSASLFTDERLICLSESRVASSLTSLDLSNSPIGMRGFIHINAFTSLKKLVLQGVGIMHPDWNIYGCTRSHTNRQEFLNNDGDVCRLSWYHEQECPSDDDEQTYYESDPGEFCAESGALSVYFTENIVQSLRELEYLDVRGVYDWSKSIPDEFKQLLLKTLLLGDDYDPEGIDYEFERDRYSRLPYTLEKLEVNMVFHHQITINTLERLVELRVFFSTDILSCLTKLPESTVLKKLVLGYSDHSGYCHDRMPCEEDTILLPLPECKGLDILEIRLDYETPDMAHRVLSKLEGCELTNLTVCTNVVLSDQTQELLSKVAAVVSFI